MLLLVRQQIGLRCPHLEGRRVDLRRKCDAMASNLLVMASYLMMASYLLVMASNLRGMASNLEAMAPKLIEKTTSISNP